jgi:hypothetical protein
MGESIGIIILYFSCKIRIAKKLISSTAYSCTSGLDG